MPGKAADSVLLHPPFAALYSAIEHAAGELPFLGDALGVDCTVVRLVDGWVRSYRGDGSRNTEWYGWDEPLLAPIDGVVENVVTNPTTNEPGTTGSPPASMIVFLSPDGLRVVYAHVRDVAVGIGQSVSAGDRVALVGNNGMSRHPHVHVGAWRDDTPFQIRFDLVVLGDLRRRGDTMAS